MSTHTKAEVIYDAVNEVIVIQAAKADPKIRKELVHRIAADEFLVPAHAVIWKALRNITDKVLELTQEVARQFILREGGSDEDVVYFDNIPNDPVTNIKYHVETLHWDATRARALKGNVPKLIAALQDPKSLAQDVASIARSLVRGFEGGTRTHLHRPGELYRDYKAEIATRRITRNIYPLGHNCFDKHLSEGFMPGRTTVTAGLSGVGKSTVWAAFAVMLAKQGRKVLWCCWEMDAKSFLDVAISYLTGIPLTKIIQGYDLSDIKTERIDKASKWIVSRITFMGNPFYSCDDSKFVKASNERNIDILEGYIAESGADIVIYDLWERMLSYTIPDAVTKALYRMQHLHEEYAVHGVIVHQLRLKDVENRVDKRPTRAAIKGVGSYVEVADLIFGLHRDGQFKAVPDNKLETICLKQRKGIANWAIQWDWDGSICFVGNPREVSYDPGFEGAAEVGDISSIKTGKRRR